MPKRMIEVLLTALLLYVLCALTFPHSRPRKS